MVTMGSAGGRRPGRSHRVYLRPEVETAFEAYLEDNGRPAVNAILLEVLEGFLVREGYLLARKVKGQPQVESQKETT